MIVYSVTVHGDILASTPVIDHCATELHREADNLVDCCTAENLDCCEFKDTDLLSVSSRISPTNRSDPIFFRERDFCWLHVSNSYRVAQSGDALSIKSDNSTEARNFLELNSDAVSKECNLQKLKSGSRPQPSMTDKKASTFVFYLQN